MWILFNSKPRPYITFFSPNNLISMLLQPKSNHSWAGSSRIKNFQSRDFQDGILQNPRIPEFFGMGLAWNFNPGILPKKVRDLSGLPSQLLNLVNFIHFGRLICDKNVEELEKMAATERLKMQMMERKTKAPNGRPKKSSVFSNRGSHFSKSFSNECETY